MFEVNKTEFIEIPGTYLMPLKEPLEGELLFVFCYDTSNKITKSYMVPIKDDGRTINCVGMFRERDDNKEFDSFGWTCNFKKLQRDDKIYLDVRIADLKHFFNSIDAYQVVCLTDKELIEPYKSRLANIDLCLI